MSPVSTTEATASQAADTSLVPIAIHHEIEQFLFREAALLDGNEYKSWLTLLTDDIEYRVFARTAREAGSAAIDYAIIDEAMVGLTSRVEQITNPRLTRAENPASLTRRLVTNIRTVSGPQTDEVTVNAYVMIYRSRSGFPEGALYVGNREDLLRKVGGQWRLARRDVRLDQGILMNGALSILL